jgi:hypothetical protein
MQLFISKIREFIFTGRVAAGQKKYQTVLLLFDIVALQLELLYKYIHSSEGAAPLYAIYRQPR